MPDGTPALHVYGKSGIMKQSDRDTLRQNAVLWVLSRSEGIGKKRLNRLVSTLGRASVSLNDAVGMKTLELAERVPGLEPQALAALRHCGAKEIREAETLLLSLPGDICAVTLFSPLAPLRWKTMLREEAPPFLFLKGNASLLDRPACAVVGRREANDEEAGQAYRCGELIAEAGFVLVSGGAAGIDRAGHNGALDAGRSTIVCLPQGISTYALSPDWQKALEEGRLLLISEYLPFVGWSTPAALARNAYIAAQAWLVCVVAPRLQGGSIATARHALKQGKPALISATMPLPADVAAEARPQSLLPEYLKILQESGERLRPSGWLDLGEDQA